MAALVLIADDDELLLDILRYRLTSSGFRVTTASDGASALAQIRECLPNVVVLDVNMPGMLGFDVLRTMRAEAGLARIPVLMLTGRRRPEDVLTCSALGAQDYLAKPFQPHVALERVRRLACNVW